MATANLNREPDQKVSLKGMPDNPGRDPKVMAKQGHGSIGDKALMDSIVIVAVAWAVLIFLAISLRHHNI
jgi:hypothetical protein